MGRRDGPTVAAATGAAATLTNVNLAAGTYCGALCMNRVYAWFGIVVCLQRTGCIREHRVLLGQEHVRALSSCKRSQGGIRRYVSNGDFGAGFKPMVRYVLLLLSVCEAGVLSQWQSVVTILVVLCTTTTCHVVFDNV